MTEKQEYAYWRMWNAACKSNAWRMQNTRLQNADPDRCPDGVNDSDMRTMILSAAQRRAESHHRAIELDDIRHAVHIAAINHDCSHKKIGNQEFGRVKWLLRLLADPNDLEAMNEWLHPGLDDRRRAIATIKHAPEAYVREIAVDRFGTVNWEDLPLSELKQLAATIATRENRRGGFQRSRRGDEADQHHHAHE